MRIGAALPFLFLAVSSCATTSQEYIDAARGYAVTRGELVQLDNLNAVGKQQLADGVSLEVSSPGCRVTLRFGKETRTFELWPGSRVVLGRSGDAILQVHGTPQAK
jgi:hypothetical protein